MTALELLALPLALLAGLTLVGAVPALLLGRRLPPDAQAALAPIAGAAVIACASTLVPFGVPVRWMGVGILVVFGLAAFALAGRVGPMLRAGGPPAVAALGGLGLASVPSLVRGNWHVASLGNIDVYLWVSQARALLGGGIGEVLALHPDRLAYDRIDLQGWAVGLPVGDALTSLVAGSEPWEVYGALAALIAALAPLAGYLLARACLGWSPAWSLALAGALALNASLVFATHNGWQGQLAGSAFLVAAAALLRLALERPAWDLAAGAALCTAAALATYRLPFLPFVVATLGAVAVAFFLANRRDARARAGALRALTGFAVLVLAFGPVSVVQLARGLPGFLGNQLSEDAWSSLPRGSYAEALGLAPPFLGPTPRFSPALAIVAALIATSALAGGALLASRRRGGRSDAILAPALVGIALAAAFSLPGFSPYLSLKALAYATPFLAALALLPLVRASTAPVRIVAAAALTLSVVSTAAVTAQAVQESRTPGALAGLAEIVPRLDPGGVVSVEIDEPWSQAWAVYFLGEQRTALNRPSIYFTGIGLDLPASIYADPAPRYRLTSVERGVTVWAGAGLTLSDLEAPAVVAARSQETV